MDYGSVPAENGAEGAKVQQKKGLDAGEKRVADVGRQRTKEVHGVVTAMGTSESVQVRRAFWK
jgi:hypothetical protein